MRPVHPRVVKSPSRLPDREHAASYNGHVAGNTSLVANALIDNIDQVIRGKRDEIRLALCCLLTEGHLLLDDVPGTGKTSLAKALLGLIPMGGGKVSFLGAPLAGRVQQRPNEIRRQLQMVFQDPATSLNPAMRVAEIVAEPVWRICIQQVVEPLGVRGAVAHLLLAMPVEPVVVDVVHIALFFP